MFCFQNENDKLFSLPYIWEYSDQFKPYQMQTRSEPPLIVNLQTTHRETDNLDEFDIFAPDILQILNKPLYSFDQRYFLAGNLHRYLQQWKNLVIDQGDIDILSWIENGVDIHGFLQPFNGNFWGVTYDDIFPPSRHFKNAKNCEQFVSFINSELEERLKSGAISLIGKVGEVEPPYIVSPITIEPSKPRLCINLMYINCFMKETPFKLDTLVDIPNMVKEDDFMTKLDDKS